MFRDNAIQLVKNRLGRRNDSELDALILDEMVMVQETICEGAVKLPWFLISEDARIETRIGEDRLPLPIMPEFLREVEETGETGSIWLADNKNDPDTTWTPLVKGDWGDLLQRFPSKSTPSHYDLQGKYFRLKPTPDAKYLLRMFYYARDVSLTTGNIENQWLKYYPDILIGHTGFIIASEYLNDQTRTAMFSAQIQNASERYSRTVEAREQTNREWHMGEAP